MVGVLNTRLSERTKKEVVDEQRTFRNKFILKQLAEKKELHVVFMNLKSCIIKYLERNLYEPEAEVHLVRSVNSYYD